MQDKSNPLTTLIRPAMAKDIEGIARVFLESAEHHAALDPERYAVPSTETIMERCRERCQPPPTETPERITLIAKRGGEIVGFVDARLEQSSDPMHQSILYCQIAEIAVAELYRHQGIGEQLMRSAEDWGREQGADFAALEYHAANIAAGEFYQQRMGYRVAHLIAIKAL